MATVVYEAREGETLSYVCWKYYGARSDAVPAVLEANPGLSAAGAQMPAGLQFILPDLPAVPAPETVQLWG